MPAVIRVSVESSLATQSVNVWHWIIPNSAPVTEANNAINALDAFYTTLTTTFAPQTFTIGSRVVTVDQSPNLIIGATSQTAAGTGASTEVLSAAAVLRMYSSIVGGSHRGRKYLGPLSGGVVASNGRELVSGTVTNITAAAATLMAVTTGGINLAVWSETTQSATAVTGVGCATTLGTQRRRIT
jgi:hypothetical protein